MSTALIMREVYRAMMVTKPNWYRPWKGRLLQMPCRSAERGGKLALSTLMAGKQDQLKALTLVLDCQPLDKDICPASMMPRFHLST